MKSKSTSVFSVIARILAAICAALFVVTAIASLVLFNVERRAFNPATYERALVNENFYQKFPVLLGDLLAKNLGPGAPAFVQHMTPNEWTTLVQALLPEPQMQTMTEDTINQLFAYLNGETQTPTVSLVPLKQSLTSPTGVNAVVSIIQAQPPCTLEQMARIVSSFGQELCNPPAEALNLIRPLIEKVLANTASALPDSVQLVTPNSQQSHMLEELRTARLVMRLSPIIPLALLLLITMLAVRTLKGWLGWWGWPLMLTGLPTSLVGFGGAPLFRTIVESILTQRLSVNMPVEIADTIRAVMDATLREMLRPVGWEGLTLFVIGLVMVLVAVYLAGREKRKIAASEAETQIF